MISMTGQSQLLPIDDISRVGEARRRAQKLAQEAGADEAQQGRIGIVVTEAATNLAKHAHNGKMAFRVDLGEHRGFEIICLDSGPGMADVGRCLTDGFSTSGTPGNGLGAIKRLSDEFSVFSLPGRGTVLFSRCNLGQDRRPAFATGVCSIAFPGETQCGDSWVVQESADGVRVMVADGLGHGRMAAQAAQEAVRSFHAHTNLPLVELLGAQHQAIRHTRGAAVMVVDINFREGRMRSAGVGNIAGCLIGNGTSRGIMSHPGIVGHEMRSPHELEFSWPKDGCLILHSDGLNSRWSLDSYPGLLGQHPALIAGTLLRDAARGRDDATVVVISRYR